MSPETWPEVEVLGFGPRFGLPALAIFSSASIRFRSVFDTWRTVRKAFWNVWYSALGSDLATGLPPPLWYHPPAMPLKTKGFESVSQLREHFTEHGDDLGASNAEAYERLADEFLGGEKPSDVSECTRTCGHIIRYDPNTDIFGILDRDGIIRTCFKPIPCSTVPFAQRASTKQAGRCHKYPNNLVYFRMECTK